METHQSANRPHSDPFEPLSQASLPSADCTRRDFLGLALVSATAAAVGARAVAEPMPRRDLFPTLSAGELSEWRAGFVQGDGQIILAGTRERIHRVLTHDPALRASPRAVERLLTGLEVGFRVGYEFSSSAPDVLQPANYKHLYWYQKDPAKAHYASAFDDCRGVPRYLSAELGSGGGSGSSYSMPIKGINLDVSIQFDGRLEEGRNWYIGLRPRHTWRPEEPVFTTEARERAMRAAAIWIRRLGFDSEPVLVSPRSHFLVPRCDPDGTFDLKVGRVDAADLMRSLQRSR